METFICSLKDHRRPFFIGFLKWVLHWAMKARSNCSYPSTNFALSRHPSTLSLSFLLFYIALLTPHSIQTPTYTMFLPLSSFFCLPYIFTTFPLCSDDCKAHRQPKECLVYTLLFSHTYSFCFSGRTNGSRLVGLQSLLSLYRSGLSTHSSLCLLSALCSFSAWITLQHWQWRKSVLLNNQLTFTKLHGVISQNTEFIIVTTMEISNPIIHRSF